jgi:two-component system, OmpR family, phosphate regulon sensor histidine kinase PhoR
MWPFLAILFFVSTLTVYFVWRRKFLSAIKYKDDKFARAQEVQLNLVASAATEQSALLNSMIEGILLLDEQGRIRLANRALEKLFKVTSSIYGKTIIEAFRNHHLAELAVRLKKEREIINFELQLSELQSRWLQVNAATIFSAENMPVGFILVFHDLTRLRQLEKTREEFVANVSHELRTPLSMIKGYVETLLDGAKDNPQLAENFLRVIEKHTDRLTFLIDDLLTIAKLESGHAILNCEQGALRPLVEKVISEFKSFSAEKNIVFDNNVPTELEVFADFARLEQVVANLIDNAIKYSRENGLVAISAHEYEGNTVEVSVLDNGPGILPEAKERIFERFFRADKSRSREQGGTGLGLAIVKHVIQSHGGKVWVESEVGKGTGFFFTLNQRRPLA